MYLEYPLNLFKTKDYVSVIGGFKLCEELLRQLEHNGFKIPLEEYANLFAKGHSKFIVSKCKDKFYIETLYFDDGVLKSHEISDYLLIEKDLLSKEELESGKIRGIKERGFLVV